MSTVIFDFDSTLIRVESLEEILAPKMASRPGLEEELREITRLGMEGKIDFATSLRQRLALASPTLAEVQAFGDVAPTLLTPGIQALIDSLRSRGVAVKIISGGFREAILPTAHFLGLSADDVGAIRLRFDATGSFAGVDPDDLFSTSKLEGARVMAKDWTRPIVAIGDGMTDFYLWEQGLADHFLAFTLWARREAVVATGAPEARDLRSLIDLLEQRL